MNAPSPPAGVLALAITGMAAANAILWVWLFWAAARIVGASPGQPVYAAVAAVTALAVPVACRAVTSSMPRAG